MRIHSIAILIIALMSNCGSKSVNNTYEKDSSLRPFTKKHSIHSKPRIGKHSSTVNKKHTNKRISDFNWPKRDTIIRINSHFSLFFGNVEEYGFTKLMIKVDGGRYSQTNWDSTGWYWSPYDLNISPSKRFTIITAIYETMDRFHHNMSRQVCLLLDIQAKEILADDYMFCIGEWKGSDSFILGSDLIYPGND